ncbi:hypothetical protein SeMB42_g04408 [Synchytrium endobioticum]|uniref:F-box domain-containing protein n=1 Tax=Synchytrium endobioticum TaxID=286115 RepID=A0A507CYG9_9FUNG|nr:hypothetical protein SeMB42_g04408 [Synchytrium endobioticum]
MNVQHENADLTSIHHDAPGSSIVSSAAASQTNVDYITSRIPDTECPMSSSGSFQVFSEELCMHMLSFLDPTSASIMGQTSKFWERLTEDDSLYRQRAKERFWLNVYDQTRRMYHESEERSWKDLYVRLDSGQTGWRGFALDRATNGFMPYPMELLIRGPSPERDMHESYGDTSNITGMSVKQESFSGLCRWSTLRDSLTKLQGFVDDAWNTSCRFKIDSFLRTTIPRMVTFQETEILRGTEIAVPNKYYGVWAGPVLIGHYDPGVPAFLGAFAVVAEETLPITPTKPIPLRVGHELVGLMMPRPGLDYKGYYTELKVFSMTELPIVSSNRLPHAYQSAYSLVGISIKDGDNRNTIIKTTYNCIFRIKLIHCKTSASPQSLPSGLDTYLEVEIPMLLCSCDGGLTFDSVRMSTLICREDEKKEDLDSKKRWCLQNLPSSNTELPLLRQGNTLMAFFKHPRVGVFFLQVRD